MEFTHFVVVVVAFLQLRKKWNRTKIKRGFFRQAAITELYFRVCCQHSNLVAAFPAFTRLYKKTGTDVCFTLGLYPVQQSVFLF